MSAYVGVAALFRTYGLNREQSRLAWAVLKDDPAPDSWEAALDSVERAIEIAQAKPEWGPNAHTHI